LSLLTNAGTHSIDQGGAGENPLPEDLQILQWYLQWQSLHPTSTVQAEHTRALNRGIEHSLIGAMPPLGPNNQQLRTQTSPNNVQLGASSRDVFFDSTLQANNTGTATSRNGRRVRQISPRSRSAQPFRQRNQPPTMPMPMSASLPGAQRMLDLQQAGNALAISMTSFLSTISQARGPNAVELTNSIREMVIAINNSQDDEQRRILQSSLSILHSELRAVERSREALAAENAATLSHLRRALFPSSSSSRTNEPAQERNQRNNDAEIPPTREERNNHADAD
jgi:hypothetical protein